MDSNTFWNIFGTSEIVTKSGLLHPRIYLQDASQIQENMESSSQNIVFSYFNISEIQNVRPYRTSQMFVVLFGGIRVHI